MKQFIFILSLFTATLLAAQQPMPLYSINNCEGKTPSSPYYYCDCHESSIPFIFPLEREIKDTVWYTATLEDLKRGVSANWISNDSITIEVYAFCSSKAPSFALTVGPNMMNEMSVEQVNKKVEAMGEMAQIMMQTLTPHIRIYPRNKGVGSVYCYPYDQGPLSTCDNPFPLFTRKTVVCSEPENVYELTPKRMASTGKGFIVWKQKNKQPGTIYITKDACDGPEIQRAVLTDSIYVMTLDADEIKAAKSANKSLFVHVEHPSNYVGRIVYRDNIIQKAQTIDTMLCQGIRLKLRDTTLVETTVYTKDTVWLGGDTLAWTTYNLTVTPPTPQYDTLRLSATALPRAYKGTYIPKDGWGDYEITQHQTNKCDELWLLHVEHKFTTRHGSIDTTVCHGRVYSYGSHTYLKDTTVVDSAWITPDIWSVDTISLQFVAPQLEYDTITLTPSQVQAGYLYAPYNIAITQFGDTLLNATRQGQCDRQILLTVLQGEDTTTSSQYLMNNRCSAGKYIRNGIIIIRRNGHDYDLYGRKIKH